MKLKWIVVVLLVAPLAALAQDDRPPGWIKDATSGCQVWNPYPRDGESLAWSGTCKDGFGEGDGVIRWSVAGELQAIDTVRLRAGRQVGPVLTIFPDGTRVMGAYVNGRPEGTWQTHDDAGSWLEEDYRDGIVQSTVRWFGPDGGRYVGEWGGASPDGAGTYTAADGETYTGQWINGCFKQGDRRATLNKTAKDCGFE